MIFDQNQEKIQPTASSRQSLENPEPLSEISSAGSENQEKSPTITYLPKPDATPMRPVEQPKPVPESSPVETAKASEKAPSDPAGTGEDQTGSRQLDKSSTESLINVIAPATKSQTKARASGAGKTDKKIIAVGGAKGVVHV